jgi:hypothetical protein
MKKLAMMEWLQDDRVRDCEISNLQFLQVIHNRKNNHNQERVYLHPIVRKTSRLMW